MAVEAVLCPVVTDAADDVTRDLLHVDVSLGANLARDDDHTGGEKRLGSASHVFELGGNTVRIHVAHGFEARLLVEDGVEHRIRDLVGNLIGMALRHGLRGKEVAARRGFARRGAGG